MDAISNASNSSTAQISSSVSIENHAAPTNMLKRSLSSSWWIYTYTPLMSVSNSITSPYEYTLVCHSSNTRTENSLRTKHVHVTLNVAIRNAVCSLHFLFVSFPASLATVYKRENTSTAPVRALLLRTNYERTIHTMLSWQFEMHFCRSMTFEIKKKHTNSCALVFFGTYLFTWGSLCFSLFLSFAFLFLNRTFPAILFYHRKSRAISRNQKSCT